MGGSVIEVILITGSDCQFMFTEVIRVLHEERAEIVRANYSVKDNTVFHIIHSKVEVVYIFLCFFMVTIFLIYFCRFKFVKYFRLQNLKHIMDQLPGFLRG